MAANSKNMLDAEILAKRRKSLTTQIIGLSEEGQPLMINFIGNSSSSHSLRILVIAGQHGDERYARRASIKLVEHYLQNPTDPIYEHAHVAVLHNANPDGSQIKSRLNVQGTDLNRDHQLLSSKEIQNIHNFARKWNPHVVLDVHNYPSKRKHLLEQNKVLNTDVFIDTTTNPAAACCSNNYSVPTNWNHELISLVQSELKGHGFSCERYALIKPSGRIRHSTLDIVDARNMLSLRYNAFGILLEGRNPTFVDGREERKRLLEALCLAMLSCIRWAVHNREHLEKTKRYIPSPGNKVPIRAKYAKSSQSFRFNFKDQQTGTEDLVTMKDYRSDLNITRVIDLPEAYAVPVSEKLLIDVLACHGFVSQTIDDSRTADRDVEYYVIKNALITSMDSRRRTKINLVGERGKRSLSNHAIFPVEQLGGNCLPLFLEPKSKFALHRYASLGLEVQSQNEYPILRVVKS